jgi:hypothetical protein
MASGLLPLLHLLATPKHEQTHRKVIDHLDATDETAAQKEAEYAPK